MSDASTRHHQPASRSPSGSSGPVAAGVRPYAGAPPYAGVAPSGGVPYAGWAPYAGRRAVHRLDVRGPRWPSQ